MDAQGSRVTVVPGDDPLTIPEPDTPHRGLGVADFPNPGIGISIRKSVRLLPPAKRRLLFAATAIQIGLGLLDLLGIVLIGLVAAVAVSGIGPAQIPEPIQGILARLGLEDVTVSQLSVILAGMAVALLVSKTVASAFMSLRITRFLANRQADVSANLARTFLSRPLIDVQRWTTSEAIYALGPGVGAAIVSLLSAAIIIAAELFLFSIMSVSLFIYDPFLTLTAIVFFTVIVLVLHRILGAWTARNARIITNTSIETLTAVSEALVTYREATVLNRRDLYVGRYERLVHRYARAGALTAFIQEIPKYVLEAALYLGILVLAIVQFLTKDWAAAATTVAIFLAAGSRVIPALLRLQGAGITIRNAAVQAQPTYFLADFLSGKEGYATRLSSEAQATVTHVIERLSEGYEDFSATVVVKDVWLTHADASEPALKDVSLVVPHGASLALVGATGAGKSTLADVILGVLSPQEGTVLVGEVSPREAVELWPGGIAYVPQMVSLVGGTVRDNVALGLPSDVVDDSRVWEALDRAHLADFLRKQRDGLETSIGERGFRLSGGQRQRLGLARALYTRPRLLVLDEATSALDAETEESIVRALTELKGTVTTVTIAHRLATVRNADQVAYLSHGRLLANGTFEEVRSLVTDFDRQAALLGL